jgi:hypothetical protein
MLRVPRLLEKFDPENFGTIKPLSSHKITHIAYVGMKNVVAVQTSTGTFVAEGLASHNCYSCGAHGTIDGHVPTVAEALAVLSGKVTPRAYAESWLDVFDAGGPSPYWTTRYGKEVATRFRCGTHPLTGNPTYPIRAANGTVLGVVQRQETKDPKYLYPKSVPTSSTLFGMRPGGVRVAVLVEGASDAMAIHTGPVPEAWRILGCYGSGVHAPQRELLADMAPKAIIAAFDHDKAGIAAAERAVTDCAHIAPVVVHDWSTLGANDPGDLVSQGSGPLLVSALRATLEATIKAPTPVR